MLNPCLENENKGISTLQNMHYPMPQNLKLPLSLLSLLLIPLIAMQFTTEVKWKIGDFLVAGVLLSLLGFGIQYILNSKLLKKGKVSLGILLVLVVILIWIELAVGLFGTPFAGS